MCSLVQFGLLIIYFYLFEICNMALKNYTTTISAEKSIAEITRILAAHGVRGIMMDYDNNGLISAMSFRINLGTGEVTFRMPCQWQSVFEVFKQQKLIPVAKGYGIDKEKKQVEYDAKWRDQAIKTAWKLILDWTDTQMALVEVNMVTIPQVFLPYAVAKDGRTLSEQILSDPKFLLG
jgi:hypothetical protein